MRINQLKEKYQNIKITPLINGRFDYEYLPLDGLELITGHNVKAKTIDYQIPYTLKLRKELKMAKLTEKWAKEMVGYSSSQCPKCKSIRITTMGSSRRETIDYHCNQCHYEWELLK
jgi:predicted RNA-binding Zn-ribbon protein involved in translation (DUF1610 family)